METRDAGDGAPCLLPAVRDPEPLLPAWPGAGSGRRASNPSLLEPSPPLRPDSPRAARYQSPLIPRRSFGAAPEPLDLEAESMDDIFVTSIVGHPHTARAPARPPPEDRQRHGAYSSFGQHPPTSHLYSPVSIERRAKSEQMSPSQSACEDPAIRRQQTTRGKWFAATRLATLASREAPGADGDGQPGSSMQATTPTAQSAATVDSNELITSDQVRAYHHIMEMLSSVNGLHAAVEHPCGNIYWDFKTKTCRPGRVWVEKMPDDIRAIVDRPFTDTEVEEIEEAIRLKEVPSQPSEVAPRAIFVIGPSAAGKSTIRTQTESHLQINLSDYVEIDGDEFRVKHEGWQRVLADKTTGYRDASNILLPYTRTLKKKFLSYAMEHRKNIILPSTGSNLEKLMKEVEMVRSHGYRVDVIGLVVSYREARARALNRAHENGRWNDGTWKKWEAAMHAITTLMDPEISDWCIIFDNQDFSNPSTIYSRAQSLTFVEGVIDAYRMQDKGRESGGDPPSDRLTYLSRKASGTEVPQALSHSPKSAKIGGSFVSPTRQAPSGFATALQIG